MSKPSSRIQDTLAQASSGLLFVSETDAPLVPFLWPDLEAPVSPQSVARLAELPTDTKIEQRDLERLFAHAVAEEDWMNEEERGTARRFQVLVATLREHLQEVTVFRVGDGPRIGVYIVGKCAEGLAGLRTEVVET